MVTNDEREKADLRAEIERWRDKAQEAGAAYGNANSKHHAELDRANRLERLADTLAGKAVDLEDRARAAEAKVARVEALADEWECDRDVCLAWIDNPEMHVDKEHPKRLSLQADSLNRRAVEIRAALAGDA